jgi:hypothetical protein
MPEWRKIFEAEDSDFGGGAQVPWKCVLPLKMGAPGASHLGTGDHGPKTDRSRPRLVPVNAPASANGYSEKIVGHSENGRRDSRQSGSCKRRSFTRAGIAWRHVRHNFLDSSTR